MASLIESLVQSSTVRQDDKRLSVTVRPPPMRLREVLEVFGAMGPTASFAGLRRSIDLRTAEPLLLANAVLGRWLTPDELEALRQDYNPWRHLSGMLLSEEFRIPLIRRAMDAFPEKTRLLHVRIPSCAGRHVLAMFDAVCPLLPLDIGSRRYANPNTLAPLLGRLFQLMSTGKSVALSLPALSPFVETSIIGPSAGDVLGWRFEAPPCRSIDQLFAIIRPPVSLALSQVNGALTTLRDQPDTLGAKTLRERLGHLPSPGHSAAWQGLARALLADSLPANPICTAIGDGTAAGALAACARTPIQLVNLAGYPEWARTALSASVIDPIGVSEPFLAPSDLLASEKAIIQARMGEDMIFYDRIARRQDATGLPMVRGTEL